MTGMTGDKTEVLPLLVADRDLRQFDSEAKALITEMQLVGWRGRVTGTGHVLMLAPGDSKDTVLVQRNSLQGRSGRNARAAFKRWLRLTTEETVSAAVLGDNAFGAGKVVREIPPWEIDTLSVPLRSRIKRHPAVEAYWESLPYGEHPTTLITGPDDEGDLWWLWHMPPSGAPGYLIAHGGDADPDEGARLLHERRPNTRLVSDVPVHDETSGQEQDVATKYVCTHDGCDQVFDTEQALAGHQRFKHEAKEWTIACPWCAETFTHGMTLAKHKRDAHPRKAAAEKKLKSDPVAKVQCRWCGRLLATPTGRATHERFAHQGEPMPARPPRAVVLKKPEEPAMTEVTGTPDMPPADAPDAVMAHLTSLPEGDDAEAMVAQIRSLVAAPLVAEVGRLRGERDELRAALESERKKSEELEAKMAIMREAMSL